MSDPATPASYVLPPALIGRADLARLAREVEAIENDLEAQKVRNRATGAAYRMPTMSRSLSDFVELNKVNLADDKGRTQLRAQLALFKDKAPVIHMTFAGEADPAALQQLITWLRQEIHPQTLLSVGLQPSLVGGVYMRTPNHVHDFSVREMLAAKRDVLTKELEGLLDAR